MSKRRPTTPRKPPEASNPPELAPVPLTPSPAADSRSTSVLTGTIDYYRLGNPARQRLSNVRPVSHYPEYANGLYSVDSELYDLFEEMQFKDGHIAGQLDSRVDAVTNCERAFMPYSSSPVDHAICEFVRDTADRFGLDGLLEKLLHALGYGVSIIEIFWDVEPDGLTPYRQMIAESAGVPFEPGPAVVPRRFEHKFPGHFCFDRAGALYLRTALASPTPVQPRRFISMAYNGVFENPYGCGLLAKVQWLYWFKKNAKSFWARASERLASPSTVAKYPAGQPAMKDILMDVLADLQNCGYAAYPDSSTIEMLHKATQAGEFGKGLEGFCTYLDNEVSKVFSSATLISNEGKASGSYALGKVHDEIRGEKIEGDARLVAAAITRDLIRPLVDYNFGPQFPVPQFSITTREQEDLKVEAEKYGILIRAGVPIGVDHIYERFRIPAPEQGQRVLRYDDNSLFQYHLQYGTITKNEVRASLGLPPMPGGDMPANSDVPAGPAPAASAAENSLADSVSGADEAGGEQAADATHEMAEAGLLRRFLAFARATSKKKAQPGSAL
jgi:phage gp29-like protein